MGGPTGKRLERRRQAQMVELLWAQAAGDRPDVLKICTRGLAGLLEVGPDARLGFARERVQHQDEPRQVLSHFVVKLTRDPAALGLFGGEGAIGAGVSLVLEPVEHLVEGGSELGDLT